MSRLTSPGGDYSYMHVAGRIANAHVICVHCNKQFASSSGLRHHLKHAVCRRISADGQSQRVTAEHLRVICVHCNKQFARTDGLRYHLKHAVCRRISADGQRVERPYNMQPEMMTGPRPTETAASARAASPPVPAPLPPPLIAGGHHHAFHAGPASSSASSPSYVHTCTCTTVVRKTPGELHLPCTCSAMIQRVGPHDVLVGRGAVPLVNIHPGNKIFRDLIDEYRPHYVKVGEMVRSDIVDRIVNKIRNRYGGRILHWCEGINGTGWQVMDDWRSKVWVDRTLRQWLPKLKVPPSPSPPQPSLQCATGSTSSAPPANVLPPKTNKLPPPNTTEEERSDPADTLPHKTKEMRPRGTSTTEQERVGPLITEPAPHDVLPNTTKEMLPRGTSTITEQERVGPLITEPAPHDVLPNKTKEMLPRSTSTTEQERVGPLITEPEPHDVLFDRGGSRSIAAAHTGNKIYLDLINANRREYLKAKPNGRQRHAIIDIIVKEIRTRYGGRFLTKFHGYDVKGWYEMDDMISRKKISDAMRKEEKKVLRPGQEGVGPVITEPEPNDILFGRGANAQFHIGNKIYHGIINANRREYLKADTTDKPAICIRIVNEIKTKYGGRFLRPFLKKCNEDDDTKGWYEVDDRSSMEKVGTALRQRPRRTTERKEETKKKMQRPGKKGVGPLITEPEPHHVLPNRTKKMLPRSTSTCNTEQERSSPLIAEPEPHDVLFGRGISWTIATEKERSGPLIAEPEPHDVLFGRGVSWAIAKDHLGNRIFRDLINAHRREYVAAVEAEKSYRAATITAAIVNEIKTKYGGRFLRKYEGGGDNDDGDAVKGWYEVDGLSSREKVRKVLRQRPTTIFRRPNRAEMMLPRYKTEQDRISPLIPVFKPNPNDILFGRGGGVNLHIGNRILRDIVSTNHREFVKADKTGKRSICIQIVQEVKTRYGGRFLKKCDEDDDTKGWYEVDDRSSTEKVRATLREEQKRRLRAIVSRAQGKALDLPIGSNEAASSSPSPPPARAMRTSMRMPLRSEITATPPQNQTQQQRRQQQRLIYPHQNYHAASSAAELDNMRPDMITRPAESAALARSAGLAIPVPVPVPPPLGVGGHHQVFHAGRSSSSSASRLRSSKTLIRTTPSDFHLPTKKKEKIPHYSAMTATTKKRKKKKKKKKKKQEDDIRTGTARRPVRQWQS